MLDWCLAKASVKFYMPRKCVASCGAGANVFNQEEITRLTPAGPRENNVAFIFIARRASDIMRRMASAS